MIALDQHLIDPRGELMRGGHPTRPGEMVGAHACIGLAHQLPQAGHGFQPLLWKLQVQQQLRRVADAGLNRSRADGLREQHAFTSSLMRVGGSADTLNAAVPPAHGCRSASWRYRYGPASAAPSADRPLAPGDGWRRSGAACA